LLEFLEETLSCASRLRMRASWRATTLANSISCC
jgi:hypothetical protein